MWNTYLPPFPLNMLAVWSRALGILDIYLLEVHSYCFKNFIFRWSLNNLPHLFLSLEFSCFSLPCNCNYRHTLCPVLHHVIFYYDLYSQEQALLLSHCSSVETSCCLCLCGCSLSFITIKHVTVIVNVIIVTVLVLLLLTLLSPLRGCWGTGVEIWDERYWMCSRYLDL